MGHKWKKIAALMEDRTPHWVETRWHCLDNEGRLEKFRRKHADDAVQIHAADAEPIPEAMIAPSAPTILRVGKKVQLKRKQPELEWLANPSRFFYRQRLPTETLHAGTWSEDELRQFACRLWYFRSFGVENNLWAYLRSLYAREWGINAQICTSNRTPMSDSSPNLREYKSAWRRKLSSF
jgi:hypothetical protein